MRLIQVFIVAIASATAMAGTLDKKQCIAAGVCDGGGANRACCDGGTTDLVV